MITKSETYRKDWDYKTQTPNADTFTFDSPSDWPEEPLWDIISEFFTRTTGRRPKEVMFMRGTYYGFETVEAWIEHINKDPEPWEVQGVPSSFMVTTKCGRKH